MTPEDVATFYWPTFAGAPRHAAFVGEHWLPQAGAPTTEAIVSALAGDGPSLSVFFLSDDSKTHVFALDVDADDGWPTVERIASGLLEAGVACYIEHSRRGGHLWVIVDRPIPAIVGRRALMAAIEAAGFDPSDKRLEIRPSTDRHTSEFAGGSLRAPWMAHPATGERFGLLDPSTGQPVHRKVAGALLALEFAPAASVAALAERYVPRLIPRASATNVADARSEREPGSVSAVLAARFGLQVVPGRSCRCPFHPDRNPSMKVAADDRRAWCHAPTCPAYENGRGITAWQAARLASVA